MSGNAAEWVNDPYTGDTEKGPLVDPYGVLSQKNNAVTRGGGAAPGAGYWPKVLRSASGSLNDPRERRYVGLGIGFRLVRTVVTTDGGGR